MPAAKMFSEIELVNGSIGDPVLYVDYVGQNDALLFDAGDNGRLEDAQLADLTAVFITHHHVDHFIGVDRIIRANMDQDKLLSIYGPVGTIQKLYDRITAYEYQYFPFQKIHLRVHEVLDDVIRVADLECARRFPQPEIEEIERTEHTIAQSRQWSVQARLVEHTVPCLAYCLIEKPGYRVRLEKLGNSSLKPGPWIEQVLTHLADDVDKATREQISIDGGSFFINELVSRFFQKTAGVRLTFITDTLLSEQSEPILRELAHKADLLYCDSFYSKKQSKAALKYCHMTATQAAQLAADAQVGQLILMHFSKRYHGRYGQLVAEASEIFPATSAIF